MRYPDFFEYSPDIYGYTTIKDDKLFSVNELGKVLKVYVYSGNKESDNVNVITSNNNTYKIDFKLKRTQQATTENFSQPTFDINQVTQTEVINVPEPLPDDFNPFVNHKSFAKRFYIISIIYLAILLFSVHFTDVSINNNYFVVLIIVPFAWVFMEHDYLFYKKHYLKMLMFSIALLCIGYYAVKQELIIDTFVFFSVLTAPFFFLIFQKALASMYIAMFKCKPDILENSLKAKVLYEIPLVIVTGMCSLFLYDFYEHLLK